MDPRRRSTRAQTAAIILCGSAGAWAFTALSSRCTENQRKKVDRPQFRWFRERLRRAPLNYEVTKHTKAKRFHTERLSSSCRPLGTREQGLDRLFAPCGI